MRRKFVMMVCKRWKDYKRLFFDLIKGISIPLDEKDKIFDTFYRAQIIDCVVLKHRKKITE